MIHEQKSMKESSSGASSSDPLTHRYTPPSTTLPISDLVPPSLQTQLQVPPPFAQPQMQLTPPSPSSYLSTTTQGKVSQAQPTISRKPLADPRERAPSVRDRSGKGSVIPSLMMSFIKSPTLIEMDMRKHEILLITSQMSFGLEHKENGAHMPTDMQMIYEQIEDIAHKVILRRWIGLFDCRSSSALVTSTTYCMEP
ncbi:hypothetical protein M9H77_16520 [Catharanthus roseus]|uniref:Uncharacterized protein n=1 Tax=Catharanthus roseus TaxID=4058 RepID=A0ACC0B262_CATRO|nr:hypothetical protein M9H77_16520 [Catharanthus roseus]